MLRAVVVALAFLAIGSAPAYAQGGPLGLAGCSTQGQSRVTEAGEFDRLPDEVVEIPSKLDGRPLQIGIVRPKGPAGYRAPVVVHASPYLAVDLKEIALEDCDPFLVENYVQHGYAVALVPTRGAGDTDGCPNLFGKVERSDLDDALTWLGTQPWSNGSIAMYGLSYDGSTPWVAAATGNKHLKTILPASGVNELFDLAYGAGTLDWRWWFFVSGYYHYYGPPFNNPVLSGREADRTANTVATCPDVVEGEQATLESYETGERDAGGYWEERNLRPMIDRNYRGSIMLIQGLQDWNVRPAHTIPWPLKLAARRGLYVKQLLGQWGHAVPDQEGIEPHFRDDFADVALAWFDRWLKRDRDARTGPRVEVEDATTTRWRSATRWPPANNETLHLTAEQALAEESGKGEASAVLAPDSRSRHLYFSDAYPLSTGNEPVNNPADGVCATCVAFTSTAPEDRRISGLPVVNVEVTPTGPTGHVTAFLYRRDPDAGLVRLGWGETDLRFPAGENSGDETPQAVEPGAPTAVRIELEPLEATVPSGQELVLVLGQGHSTQMPGRPPAPVQLRYGGKTSTLRLAITGA